MSVEREIGFLKRLTGWNAKPQLHPYLNGDIRIYAKTDVRVTIPILCEGVVRHTDGFLAPTTIITSYENRRPGHFVLGDSFFRLYNPIPEQGGMYTVVAGHKLIDVPVKEVLTESCVLGRDITAHLFKPQPQEHSHFFIPFIEQQFRLWKELGVTDTKGMI